MAATEPADPMAWAQEYTPVLEELANRYSETLPLEGYTIAVATHMEAKSGVFVKTLRAAGAEVLFTGSEPHSTDPAVVEELDSIDGIEAYIDDEMSRLEWEEAIDDLLRSEPDFILDDGAELMSRLYADHPSAAESVIAGAEQTTTGITRLEAMEADDVLAFPVYGVNNTPMKNYFDNVHGTGESSLVNITMTTNTMLTGKTVVVAGYGYCGRGLARKAAGLGAETIVTEVDPRKALEAVMDGHQVMEMAEAAPKGDYFITATGNSSVIREAHIRSMSDGAILANAGHVDVEIPAETLEELATETVTPEPGVTQYVLPDGRRINLLADGKLVNLTAPASKGHPAEVMDTTFAMMVVAAIDLLNPPSDREPGLYAIPDELDREIASLKLETMDVAIDSLTADQSAYQDEWRPDRGPDYSSPGR